MKKTTRATFKKFLRENKGKLLINVKSEFDGMTDCCESQHAGFQPAKENGKDDNYTLGINGVYLVGHGGDRFRSYSENGLNGIEVYNCCGHFVVVAA